MKKVLSFIIVLVLTSICAAMTSWPNQTKKFDEPYSKQTHSVCKVNEKPKCSKVVNGRVCGGTLELSFTAYKKTTKENCPFCSDKKEKGCQYCDKGKLWEWQAAKKAEEAQK